MDKEAAEVLKHIADKIDVPVQQLWAGLVAYAPFTYWQWLVTTVITGSLVLIAAAVIIWALRKADDKSEHFFGVALLAFFCGAGAMIVFGVAGIGGMSEALAAKNAPEAWAAHKIIRNFDR